MRAERSLWAWQALPSKFLFFSSRVVTQARNYSKVVYWLLHSAFRKHLKALFAFVVLSALHLAGQAAGIFTLYWYARQMEKGAPITLPYLSIRVGAGEELGLLLAVVILCAIGFGSSVFFQYVSRRVILGVAEQNYADRLERLVLTTNRLPDPRAPVASRLFVHYGLSRLAVGCRFGTFATITFCSALSGLLGAIGAAVFLVRIDPTLSLLILLSALVGATLFYPLALRAVQVAKTREHAERTFTREARNIHLSHLKVSEFAPAAPHARSQLGMRRFSADAMFAAGLSSTFIIAVVVFYMASQMLAGRQEWAVLIAYVGALRLTLARTNSRRAPRRRQGGAALSGAIDRVDATYTARVVGSEVSLLGRTNRKRGHASE